MERERFQRIGFDDGVGRAFDRAGVSESAQDAARERGFPAPKSPCRWMTNVRRAAILPNFRPAQCGLFVGSRREKVAPALMEISLIVFSKTFSMLDLRTFRKHYGEDKVR